MPKPIWLVFLLCSPVHAITWSFDQPGDAQGWVAQEDQTPANTSATLSLLSAATRNGVWRIDLLPHSLRPHPAANAISPVLGCAASLFDQVRVRFRMVHHSPVQGRITLRWTTAENASSRSQPHVSQELTYGTGWQEATFDGFPQSSWTGELHDIRIEFTFVTSYVEPAPADSPEAVEIDWIRLTGVEEQLSGELPPPGPPARPAPGTLFQAAAFSPLGAQTPVWDPPYGPGVCAALGDADGDGHVDLATVYFGGASNARGWLVARGDGAGAFSLADREEASYAALPALAGGDLDGDGTMEIVVPERHGAGSQVLGHDPESGWAVWRQLPGSWSILGLGDAEGDGDLDLWASEAMESGRVLRLLLNDGSGGLAEELTLATPVHDRQDLCPFCLADWADDGATGALWNIWGQSTGPRWVSFLATDRSFVSAPLSTPAAYDQFQYVGDIDGDGDVDIVSALSMVHFPWSMNVGLSLLRNAGDGTMVDEPWYEDVLLTGDAAVHDLNLDGMLDVTLVDGSLRDPGVIVQLARGDGSFQVEGRYPLSGRGGAVLAGDVDGDGDPDLVVLERAAQGQGGVHILLNRLAEGITAVSEDADAEGAATLPRRLTLHPAYPNPFNPEVTIPFTLAADAQRVRLVIYNVLGQAVRTLVDGPLPGGEHRAVWDGRDERGTMVPSGVCFHRLEAGGQPVTGRCVRVE